MSIRHRGGYYIVTNGRGKGWRILDRLAWAYGVCLVGLAILIRSLIKYPDGYSLLDIGLTILAILSLPASVRLTYADMIRPSADKER